VLVAATTEPALDGVKADLDPTWRIQHVCLAEAVGDIAIVSALVPEAEEHAVERAFELARSRSAHVASVGMDGLVAGAAERHQGVHVAHLTLAEALPLLMHEPAQFDVVVSDTLFVEALSDMAAYSLPGKPLVASGRLSVGGHGIFGPTHCSALEIAGMGVVDPSAMLLAASLMLGEGLGERAAGRTLERAVRTALREAHLGGLERTTREFTQIVLAELPRARTDTEFFTEVHA
jgi:3-isopropylmalate dehydrogenase